MISIQPFHALCWKMTKHIRVITAKFISMFEHFSTLCMRGLMEKIGLNLLNAKAPPYRNQSIDLQSKSIDWFLYGDNFGV